MDPVLFGCMYFLAGIAAGVIILLALGPNVVSDKTNLGLMIIWPVPLIMLVCFVVWRFARYIFEAVYDAVTFLWRMIL